MKAWRHCKAALNEGITAGHAAGCSSMPTALFFLNSYPYPLGLGLPLAEQLPLVLLDPKQGSCGSSADQESSGVVSGQRIYKTYTYSIYICIYKPASLGAAGKSQNEIDEVQRV